MSPPIPGSSGVERGSSPRGGGKCPPLARSFQRDPGLANSNELEALPMNCHVMMEPAQGHQAVGIGGATVQPGFAAVDFETISG